MISMKAIRPALGLMAGIAFLAASAQASADTIAQWTFESSAPASAGPFAAEVGSGTAAGYHAGAAAYSSPAGNGSLHSFSSTAWAIGDYYQFQVTTLGYDAISLSWDQTSSNTGPRDFKLAYSTDGTGFSDFATYSVLANASPNSPWSSTGARNAAYTFSEDLSSIAALDNQVTVFFRLIDNSTTSATGGTVGSGGTDRIDNFTVSGLAVAAVPEPETYAMLVAGLGLLGAIARRRTR